MKYYLVQFSDNWADEMDLEGFKVLEGIELEQFEHAFEELDDWITVHFGTNEENEYSNSDELRSKYSVTEIYPLEAQMLQTRFGQVAYGHWPDPKELVKQQEEW